MREGGKEGGRERLHVTVASRGQAAHPASLLPCPSRSPYLAFSSYSHYIFPALGHATHLAPCVQVWRGVGVRRVAGGRGEVRSCRLCTPHATRRYLGRAVPPSVPPIASPAARPRLLQCGATMTCPTPFTLPLSTPPSLPPPLQSSIPPPLTILNASSTH